MTSTEHLLKHVDEQLDHAIERLASLVSIPSISADSAYNAHCTRAAEHVVADLNSMGFDAQVIETGGQPMVFGRYTPKNAEAAKKPRALFYGHYDVQPATPEHLWHTPPFELVRKKAADGKDVMYGRGVSDDKGQFMTFVEAFRAFKECNGDLPMPVSVLIEGEEESGSTSLAPFLEAHKDKLDCDLLYICDTGLAGPDTPAITIGLRGLVYEELEITAAHRDLHSGTYGGVAHNAINLLCRVLASMHDESGRVCIPDFYDGVVEASPQMRASWSKMPEDGKKFLGKVGLTTEAGEKDREFYEKKWTRPTADVNGIWGGYMDEGAKTVIASKASAKVSFRLVGQQNPQKIIENFRKFIQDQLPPDCSVKFTQLGAGPALLLPTDDPYLQTTSKALSEEWNNDTLFIGMGGSIPITGDFQSVLGKQSILVGFGLDDDSIHSPNERYEVKSFHKGIRSWVRIISAISQRA